MSTTIKAAFLLSVRHRPNMAPLLPTLVGERTIDLYLKPVNPSCAPRKRHTTGGTSVAQQRHLPPSWESAPTANTGRSCRLQ